MVSLQMEGRLGYLTHTQELILRELWRVTLETFDIKTSRPKEGDTASVSSSSPDSMPCSETFSSVTSDTTNLTNVTNKIGGVSITEVPDSKTEEEDSQFSKIQKGNEDEGRIRRSLHHLSVISSFHRKKCKSGQQMLKKMSPAELRDTFWSLVKGDHPDALLLRFLRARKWEVEPALKMLINTIEWREADRKVDAMLKEGEEGFKKRDEELLKQMRVGKSFFYGTDKAGRPLCYVRVRLHKPKDQSYETIERFTIWVMETGRLLLRPPVDTACVVFDLSDTSLINMDLTPVKFVVNCFEAHYPESLGCLIIHKAPWVFQGLWSLIKGWLDPVVASKINFTRNLCELEKFIEPSQIIKELGGPNEWQYEYPEPCEGENSHMSNKEELEQFQKKRCKLCRNFEDMTLDWLAAGDDDFGQIMKERDAVALEMVKGYWQIDKYVRARTLYDRMGVIGDQGEYRPFGKTECGVQTEYPLVGETTRHYNERK